MSTEGVRKSLAEEYLKQAVEALRSSGSPDGLYGEEVRRSQQPMMRAAGRALARGKRVGFSRTGVLFAALSAEAYINQHLDEHLSRSDFDAVDRLPTVEKYVIGTRLTTGAAVFDRGTTPIQQIKALFSLRDKLVHSKPRLVPARNSVFDDPAEFDTYNPEVLATYVIAVAQAAGMLASHSGSPPDFTTVTIAQDEQFIVDFGRGASGDLPPVDGTVVTDLVMEIVKRVTGRTKDYTTPR